MRQPHSSAGILARIALFVLILAVPVFFASCLRYGGPEGLIRRARAEVAALQPHPEFVPTPFDTAAVSVEPAPATASNPLATPVPVLEPAETGVPAQMDGGGSVMLLPLTAGSQEQAEPSAVEAGVTATPSEPAAAPTAAPTATTAPTATAMPAATPAFKPAAPSVQLTGLAHFWQTWNNCGPATLAMNLSYYGLKLGQADVAATLRPDKDDKNVNAEEMAAFAQSQGLNALVRVNGDRDRLRTLVSNGIPVLIETWLEPEPNDGMGHYRLITGYDDERREWIMYDSYVSTGVDPKKPYSGIRISYDEMDKLWAVFNRNHVIIFSDEKAPVVASILGDDTDDTAMWQRSLRTAEAEVQQQPENAFAHFNVGTSLVALGRYPEAAAAYDRARVIRLPWRMLWYQFGPFKAYYESGRIDEVISLADATLKTVGNVEELFYWKGLALKAKGDLAGARAAWQRAVKLNPNYSEASAALASLGQ